MNNKLFAIADAANILGVSTKTLRRWDQRGRFVPTRTVGNQRRYTQQQIAEFKTQNSKLKTTPSLPSALSQLPSNSFLKDHFLLKPEKIIEAVQIQESQILSHKEDPSLRSGLQLGKSFKMGIVFAAFLFVVTLTGAIVIVKYDMAASFNTSFNKGKNQLVSLIKNLPQFSLGAKSPSLSFVPQVDIAGSVLAAATGGSELILKVNIPSTFSESVSFLKPLAIGSDTFDDSAILDLTSEDKGFLAPRMTTVQRDAIASPATGLFVYNTITNQYNMYNGTAWVSVGGITAVGDVTEGSAFAIAGQGNSLYFHGTGGGNTQVTGGSSAGTSNILTLPDTTGTFITTGNLTLITKVGTITSGVWNGTAITVANGGTGATTLTGILLGNGTSPITALTTSLGISGAITDETGTGLMVFNTDPVFAGNITPTTTSTSDLGSTSLYFNNVYANNFIGAATGTAGYWQRNGGALSPTNISDDLLVGGTSTASAKFRVTGNSAFAGTLSVASISATTSFAGLVVDNTIGDLFTASSSGLNRFVIKQSGNVGIGTASAVEKLHIEGFIRTQPVDWKESTTFTAAEDDVNAMAEYNGKLYAGLGSSVAGEADIWALEGDTWVKVQDFGTSFTAVNALAVHKGKLYASTRGATTGSIYVYDGTSWTVSTSLPTGINSAYFLIAYNDKLYAGLGDGSDDADVYVFDGANWTLSKDFGSGYRNANAAAVYNGKLYVGLGTDDGDGDLWVFDGNTWSSSNDFGSLADSIESLAVYNGKLYAALASGSTDGEAYVWVFDGVSWTLSNNFGASPDGVFSLGVYNGKLYAGLGNNIGDADVYSFDGYAWTLVNDMTTSRQINVLTVHNGKLYAAMSGSTGDPDEAQVWVYSDRLESQLVQDFDPVVAPFNEQPQHFTNLFSIAPGVTIPSAASATWNGFSIPATTATVSGSTNITTAAGFNLINIARPTIHSAASAITITNAATMYIANSPTAGGIGPATITNAYSLWVDDGVSRFDGNVGFGGQTTPLTALDVTGSASLSANISMRGAATAHTFNILDNGTLNIQRSPGGDAGLATALFIQNNGSVGIGTATPVALVHFSGPLFSTLALEARDSAVGEKVKFINSDEGALRLGKFTGDDGTGFTTQLTILNSGNVGIGTTMPSTLLTLANSGWMSGVDSAGTGVVNMFKVNASDQIEVGGALTVDGSLVFPSDAGYVTAADLPLTSGQSANTANGYTFAIASADIMTVYGENDGTGVLQNGRIGIGTIAPLLRLDVRDSQAATAAAQIYNTSSDVDADGLIVKLGNTSTTAVAASNHFLSFETFGIGIVGSVQGSTGKGVTYATSGIADFAEYFKKDKNQIIPFGSVVCFDDQGLAVTCDNNSNKIIGVASERPAFLGGENLGDRSIAVGLVGQVRTRVSTANGAIKIGDPLTTSSTAGIAVKATSVGQILGKAIEGFDGQGEGEILVSVNITWYNPQIYVSYDGTLAGMASTVSSIGDQLTLQGETLQAQAGLQNQVSDLELQFSLLSQKVTEQASISAFLMQVQSGQVLGASTSASLLGNLGDIEINNATASGDLMVLGRATVTDLGVTGIINAGLLSIHGLDSEINTLAGNLYLQKNGLGGIDILSGKIIIDTQGNIKVEGTVTAEVIEAKNYAVVGDESIGSSAILEGETFIEISTSVASESSKIFLTATSLTDKQITVVEKNNGTFKVAIPQATTAPITFDWWIVGNKNN